MRPRLTIDRTFSGAESVTRSASLLLVLTGLAHPALAQDDSTAHRAEVSGLLTVSTKGISTIPSFTYGKPAAIADVSIARNGFSFEPQFKFGLDGKPWAFLFWGRYRLLEAEKLRVTVGAHPALNFRPTRVTAGRTSNEIIVARRYLAGELSSSYSLSRSVSVGPYYLYGYGVEQDVAKHTHFVSLRGSMTAPGLPAPYVVHFTPQAYYLKTGTLDGTYLYAGLTVSKGAFPVYVSSVVNQVIRTDIAGARFLWNVNLHYAIR